MWSPKCITVILRGQREATDRLTEEKGQGAAEVGGDGGDAIAWARVNITEELEEVGRILLGPGEPAQQTPAFNPVVPKFGLPASRSVVSPVRAGLKKLVCCRTNNPEAQG